MFTVKRRARVCVTPRQIIAGALALTCLGVSGCAPRLIQDYVVRDTNFVFAVQEGAIYQLGECQRRPNGDLYDCRMYEVEFE